MRRIYISQLLNVLDSTFDTSSFFLFNTAKVLLIKLCALPHAELPDQFLIFFTFLATFVPAALLIDLSWLFRSLWSILQIFETLVKIIWLFKSLRCAWHMRCPVDIVHSPFVFVEFVVTCVATHQQVIALKIFGHLELLMLRMRACDFFISTNWVYGRFVAARRWNCWLSVGSWGIKQGLRIKSYN